MRFRTVAVLAVLCAPSLLAEDPALPVPPTLHLPRITTPITIDGDLSDPGWADAIVIETFYEFQPGDNTVPPVKTIARVGCDDKYFYASFWCEEPDDLEDPRAVRRPRRRDRPAGLRRRPARRGQRATLGRGLLDQPERNPDRLDAERVALRRGHLARLVLAVGRKDRHELVDGRGRAFRCRRCAIRTRIPRTGR